MKQSTRRGWSPASFPGPEKRATEHQRGSRQTDGPIFPRTTKRRWEGRRGQSSVTASLAACPMTWRKLAAVSHSTGLWQRIDVVSQDSWGFLQSEREGDSGLELMMVLETSRRNAASGKRLGGSACSAETSWAHMILGCLSTALPPLTQQKTPLKMALLGQSALWQVLFAAHESRAVCSPSQLRLGVGS